MPAPTLCTEDVLLSLRRPIAVVGNGLPDRPMGSLIDRYATVIRLNNFEITGHEAMVGQRTSLRVTSGWHDIRHHDRHLELSPFTEDAHESGNLAAYRADNAVPVLAARTDVHALLPDLPKPSTGLSLLALCAHLGIPVDAFGFDGFRSGHYWRPDPAFQTVHARSELDVLLTLPGVTLYGASYPYKQLYDFCFSQHPQYVVSEGLALFQRLDIQLTGERIIEFGAGTGALSQHLERMGNEVTAIEVSEVAFARIPVRRKVRGDCITLAMIDEHFDRFVSTDVLEHLTENDLRIVFRQAARLADSMLVTVSTRPSGLLGPNGENLHLTVRPVSWWVAQLQEFFDVQAAPGLEVGQAILYGVRRTADAAAPAIDPPGAIDLALPAGYRARTRVEADTSAIDAQRHALAYTVAGELAQALDCDTVIGLGTEDVTGFATAATAFKRIAFASREAVETGRLAHPAVQWLEADFEALAPLPLPDALLAHSVIACAGLLERLADPRPALSILRALLEHAPALVLTSTQRTTQVPGADEGPPAHPAHCREWTADELADLLARIDMTLASVTTQTGLIVAVAVNPNHPAIAQAMDGGRSAAASDATPRASSDATPFTPSDATPFTPSGDAPFTSEDDASDARGAGAPHRSALLEQAALTEVSAMEAQHPDDPAIALSAAELRETAGDLDGSLASAQRATRLTPSDPQAHYRVARAALQLERIDLFEPALARTLELQPRHHGALHLLARLQLDHGDVVEAGALYEALLELDAADDAALEGAVICRLRAGTPERAAALLNQHLRPSTERPTSLLEIA